MVVSGISAATVMRRRRRRLCCITHNKQGETKTQQDSLIVFLL
jgi:hypothetical protein